MLLAQEFAVQRTVWEEENLGGYKRLYPSEEKERQYMAIHDAAIGIWEMLMGGTSRRSVRLSAPPRLVDDGTEAGTEVGERPMRGPGKRRHSIRSQNSVEARSSGNKILKDKNARTAEQVKEVVERLSAGVSARPRPNDRRSSIKEPGPLPTAIPPSTEEEPAASTNGQEASEEAVPAVPSAALVEQLKQPNLVGVEQLKQPSLVVGESPRQQLRPLRPEVRVGDFVKVQTNLGWESVVIRLKRANGRVDIQFKDGEYMRSVMPRILKENGVPAVIREGSSVPEGGGGGSSGSTSRGANTASASIDARILDTTGIAARSASCSSRGERSTSPPLPGVNIRQPSPVVGLLLGSTAPANMAQAIAEKPPPTSVAHAAVRGRDASPAAQLARLSSTGRVRGSPWHGTSIAASNIGHRGLVQRGSVTLQATGSFSATPRTSAQEADLQQNFKHLFRVRTVNI
jgi:hypothetical protein